MSIAFSSRIFSILRDLRAEGGPFDITPLHAAALEGLSSTAEWQPQSLSASQIVLTQAGGYSLTLQGSGISPVSSLEALIDAIDAGIATGAFSSMVLRQNGTELARVTLQSTGWTLSSDTLSLSVTGAVPTTLQQLIALASAEANSWTDPQALITLLNTYALTGLSLVNAGQELFGLSLAATTLQLRLPGLTGTLPGSFATRLGDLVAAITRAEDAAGWDDNWFEILMFDEFGADTLTFRDGTGAVVLQLSEPTGPQDETAYYLLDQQVWIDRALIDPHMDALLDGSMALVSGTSGPDVIVVTQGPALVLAGAGNDRVTGSTGNDLLIGGEGNDLLIGGLGNDTIWGDLGNDTIWGGAGNDHIWLSSGTNEVWAGAGRDTLFGGDGDDILGGGADDDWIHAGPGGRNQLWGADGNDTLWSGGNGDMAGGGGGDDIVNGGAGNDTLMGGLGNDTVHGNAGADAIYLGMGNDQGHGGAGNDTITAGPGFDRVWGGDGADRFEFWRSNGWTRIEDFDGAEGDVIALGRGMWTGTHGALTAQQVVNLFGSVNASGDAVLNFAAAGTTVVIIGAGTLAGLADDLVIL